MGHRYPPRGPIGDAVIIGSVAWPKTYSSCRERASRPARSLKRRGVLPRALPVHLKGPGQAWLSGGFLAMKRLQIIGIGKQSINRGSTGSARPLVRRTNGKSCGDENVLARLEAAPGKNLCVIQDLCHSENDVLFLVASGGPKHQAQTG